MGHWQLRRSEKALQEWDLALHEAEWSGFMELHGSWWIRLSSLCSWLSHPWGIFLGIRSRVA